MRFPFFTIALAACMLLPAVALELSDLRLPLTRSEADKALSRDYSFRVLEDLTVRRSWELPNRAVSVDFSPKEGDKALLIFITYNRPVTRAESAEDAAKLLGTEVEKWQQAKAKYALRLGMEAADGVKLAGDRYCFRELNEEGKVLRLAYYATTPSKVVRWELADDARESVRTAMGTRASAGNSDFLWKDEERRRGVMPPSASSSPESLASAAAAVVAAPVAAPPAPARVEPAARPADTEDLLTRANRFIAEMTPTHYAIAGAVLGLLLLHLMLRARAARRRAEVAAYIMNQNRKRG